MTGQTATGGSVRGREARQLRGSTAGWTPIVVFVAALVVLLGVAVGPASADPSISEKRAQARAIMAQVQELDADVARAAEAYNYATIELDRVKSALELNAKHLVVARKSLGVAQQRIAQRLRELYVSGDGDSTLEVLLGASSLDDIINGFDAIQRVSSQDTRVLNVVKKYRRQVETHRVELKDARETQEQVVADRAAQKQAIESRLAERERLLASVRDEIAQLQAEERRRAAAAAREARARLAAQRLAAQQAVEARVSLTDTFASESLPAAPPPDGDRASQVIAIAMQYLGVPYVWGGSSPSTGFDCSGFTSYVFAQIGVSLPHHAASQYNYGVPVSRSELQPADLVFFNGLGHMGMYIGGGQFIHAPHTGDVVKISSIHDAWYASRWVGARRVL